jgi:hypothetical protein
VKLKSSLVIVIRRSPRFLASLIFVHESDRILGGLGGFHCSSIDSILKVVIVGVDSVNGVDSVDGKRP